MVNPITPGSPVTPGSNNGSGPSGSSPSPGGDSQGPSFQFEDFNSLSNTIDLPPPAPMSISSYAQILGLTSNALIDALYNSQELNASIFSTELQVQDTQTLDNAAAVTNTLNAWPGVVSTFQGKIDSYNLPSSPTPTETMNDAVTTYQAAITAYNLDPNAVGAFATFTAATNTYNTAVNTYNNIVNNVNNAIAPFNDQVPGINTDLATVGGFTHNESTYDPAPNLLTAPTASAPVFGHSYDGSSITPVTNPNTITPETSTIDPPTTSTAYTTLVNNYYLSVVSTVTTQNYLAIQQSEQYQKNQENSIDPIYVNDNIVLPASYITTFPPTFTAPESAVTVGISSLGDANNNPKTADALGSTLLKSTGAVYQEALVTGGVASPVSVVYKMRNALRIQLQQINLTSAFPSLALLVHSQNATGNAPLTPYEEATAPIEQTIQTLVGLTTASQIAGKINAQANGRVIPSAVTNALQTNISGMDPTQLSNFIHNISNIQNASMLQVALGVVGQVLDIPNLTSQMVSVAQNGASQPINPTPPVTVSDALKNPVSLNYLKSNLSNSLAGSGGTSVAGTQAPIKGTQAPTVGAQAPTAGSQAPTVGSQAPTVGAQAPITGMQSFITGTQSPVAGTQTPITGLQTPIAGTQGPISGNVPNALTGVEGLSLTNAQILVNNAVNSTIVNNPNIQTTGQFTTGLNAAFLNAGLTPSQSNTLSIQAGAYIAAETLTSYLLEAQIAPGTINPANLYNALVNPVIPPVSPLLAQTPIVTSPASINNGTVAAAAVIPIGQDVAAEVIANTALNEDTSLRNLRDRLYNQLINNQEINSTQAMLASTQAVLSTANPPTTEQPTAASLNNQIYNNTLNLLTPNLGSTAAQQMAAQTVAIVMGKETTNVANATQNKSMMQLLVNSINNLSTLQNNNKIDQKDFRLANESFNSSLKPTVSITAAVQEYLSPANNLVYSMYTGMMYQGMVPHKYPLPLEFMV